MNNYAAAIRDALTMETVATYYGYEPNRAGFIQCPFHGGEKTASLKIYGGKRGWHCYGCHMGGDTIDFIKELYTNGDFKAACKKLDNDFCLGLIPDRDADSQTRSAADIKARELANKRLAEQTKHNQLKKNYEEALDRWARNDYIIINFPLCSDEWHSALNDIGYSKYLLGEAQTALYEYEHNERDRGIINSKLV